MSLFIILPVILFLVAVVLLLLRFCNDGKRRGEGLPKEATPSKKQQIYLSKTALKLLTISVFIKYADV